MKKIAFFLLITSTYIFASITSSVGSIVALRGEADILRDARHIKVLIGTKVEEKDVITTMSNAKLQMIFDDKTIITLGKSSTFSINNYVHKEKKSKANFSMIKGTFKTITGKIGKIAPERFKIQTKSATIGIRGTGFLVDTDETYTNVVVTQGEVVVSDNEFGDSVNVPAGYSAEKLKGKTLFQPVPSKPKELKKILDKLTAHSVEKKNKKIDVINDESVKKRVDIEESNRLKKEINDVNDIKNIRGTSRIDNSAKDAETTRRNIIIEENTGNSINDEVLPSLISRDEVKVEVNANDYMTWGYWNSSSKKAVDVYVDGITTAESIVATHITNNVKGTYEGSVIGLENGSTKVDGSFQLDVDFAQKSIELERFDVSGGAVSWSLSGSGNMNSQGAFQATLKNSVPVNSTNSLQTGTLSGSFYGTNAEAVGGTASLQSGANSLEAVFAGSQ